MPTVSVIIPCYNHAHYLSYAVESVLAQTFPDWEAVIVDDGSTDGTRQVAGRFSDPRIHYIHQGNQGLSAARNTGIRHAEGPYLSFLDADDALEPKFLARCIQVLAADKSLAGLYAHTFFIDETGAALPSQGTQSAAREAFHGRILQGGFFPVHAAVVRAEAVREVGLFDTQLTSLEDWDLWIRISEDYEMACVHEPLVRYRVYPGSMSTDPDRMHANRIAVLTKHFGPPEGDPGTWPAEKRQAYGFAYRSSALGYIQQNRVHEAWRLMDRAVSAWPSLLQRLDTFYELACGDQRRGRRGQPDPLDIAANAAEMLRGLDALFSDTSQDLHHLRRAGYGNAYLALGMLSDQANCWRPACRYLVRAAQANPNLLRSVAVVRRLLKVCVRQLLLGSRCFDSRIGAQPGGASLPGEGT